MLVGRFFIGAGNELVIVIGHAFKAVWFKEDLPFALSIDIGFSRVGGTLATVNRVPSRNFCLGGGGGVNLMGLVPCLTKNLSITWTTTVYPTAAKIINSIPVHPSIPTACIYANSR